ncbi:MAG: hypothetical protein ABJG47_08710 [Ekhidna sp.]
MRLRVLLLIALLSSIYISYSQVKVKGYYRKDGTYVKPHYRSNPDGNPYNNWSYPGNVNPYTGKVAKGNPDTYLKNYYKVYPNSNTESNSYRNYVKCLSYTDYSGIKKNYNYDISSDDKKITYGYVRYSHDEVFRIYNHDKNHIGYVQLRKKGKRYNVYDLEGYEIKPNKKSGNEGLIVSLI